MNASAPSVDATKDNFAELVEKSREIPVVVDFWAEWCGPCKQLMPMLAKLNDEYGGRFLLAKVDTDAEQELALHFQIRSIPTVKIIKDGAIVDEFTGVQPESNIREILDRHCAPAGEDDSDDSAAPTDELSAAAIALLQNNDLAGAISVLEAGLAEAPDNASARITLAQLQLENGDHGAASKTLDAVPEDTQDDRYSAVAGLIHFSEIAADTPPPASLEQSLAADANNSEARFQLSAHLILANRIEDALDHLLSIVSTDRKYGDDAARDALLHVFNMLDADNPLTLDYRRRLARLLN